MVVLIWTPLLSASARVARPGRLPALLRRALRARAAGAAAGGEDQRREARLRVPGEPLESEGRDGIRTDMPYYGLTVFMHGDVAG